MAVYVTQHIVFITISLAITLATVCVFDVCLVEAAVDGFSVELVHRDSPKSPLYDPAKRINHFNRAKITPNAAQPVLPVENGGPYLIQISIGTPPRKIWGIFDTGSSLVWTQCKPCKQCIPQKDPLFDPKASSTYKAVPSQSPQCESVGGKDDNDGICHYTEMYDEVQHTNGILSLDTVTLDSTSGPLSLPGTIFGCGNDNIASYPFEKQSGRIGFGNKNHSLIGQLGSFAAGKFSYCLTYDFQSSSKMNFGTEAVLKGPGVVSTPLIPHKASDYYFVTIVGISVGNERLNYTSLPDEESGNIAIDAAASVTIFPIDVYRALVDKVSQGIHLPKYTDEHLLEEQLCYKTVSDIPDPPIVTIHFKGGADVKLSYSNTFNRYEKDVVCLSFSHRAAFPVFGNYQQVNFLIGFDLQAKTLSFKPTDCTK